MLSRRTVAPELDRASIPVTKRAIVVLSGTAMVVLIFSDLLTGECETGSEGSLRFTPLAAGLIARRGALAARERGANSRSHRQAMRVVTTEERGSGLRDMNA
jgi:hypothetical protein